MDNYYYKVAVEGIPGIGDKGVIEVYSLTEYAELVKNCMLATNGNIVLRVGGLVIQNATM